MTDQGKSRARELKGRLLARQESLEHDIKTANILIPYLLSDHQHGYQEARADVMGDWLTWNASILAEVEQLLKEVEDAEEEANLPL